MQRRIVMPVAIALDRERSLLFDMNAIVSYEEATGKSPLTAIAPLVGAENLSPEEQQVALARIRFADFRALLWAALLHEDATLTQKEVGSWLGFSGMLEVLPALITAVVGAYPADDGKNGGGEPADPPTPNPTTAAS